MAAYLLLFGRQTEYPYAKVAVQKEIKFQIFAEYMLDDFFPINP